MSSSITIKNVGKTFESITGPIVALANVNLDVKPGEFMCLVGLSGCGKSTVLFISAGLVKPNSGEVRIGNNIVLEPSPDRTVVFQGDSVFPWMTVAQNIGYGLKFMDIKLEEQKTIVNHLINKIGLQSFRDSYPKELSGGMKKRVDLARAYATNPTVLLMDEPFGALDAITKEKMQVDLMKLTVANFEKQKTVLFVTHDLEEAIFLADRVAIMTPRPGTIQSVLKIPFPRPRDAKIRLSNEFQEIRRHIRELLETNQEF